MWLKWKLLLLFLMIFLTFGLKATEKVIVGGYLYPPFVISEDEGLTLDLIEYLNQKQTEYEFIFRFISPKRRYPYMQTEQIDMIMFEDYKWEWENKDVEFTAGLLIDSDKFVALKSKASDQSYFENLKNKKIGLIYGYHYKFLDLKTVDQSEKYNTVYFYEQKDILKHIINKNIDLGVVMKFYLSNHIDDYPKIKGKILISEKVDGSYLLRTIIGKHSPLKTEKYENILRNYHENKSFKNILHKYNIEKFLIK